MKVVRFIVLLLMVIGALNWGLVGFFQYNFIADIFGGEFTGAARFVFAIVGLAGLFSIGCLFRCSKSCKNGSHCGCCSKKDH